MSTKSIVSQEVNETALSYFHRLAETPATEAEARCIIDKSNAERAERARQLVEAIKSPTAVPFGQRQNSLFSMIDSFVQLHSDNQRNDMMGSPGIVKLSENLDHAQSTGEARINHLGNRILDRCRNMLHKRACMVLRARSHTRGQCCVVRRSL
jgi:hypothetical protein